jgi:hypothetical protein
MTAEARRAIQGICLDSRHFAYGPKDWGSAARYKEKYTGFTDEEYAIFEMYSNGMTAKQHRNALKKTSKNGKANSKCSR